MPTRIAINGFGRIGRQLTRQLLRASPGNLMICAVNTMEPIETAAHLLRYDSCYGQFTQKISLARQTLLTGEQSILFYHHSEPDRLPWRELGIDVVLECSGQATTGPGAAKHLAAGARKVLITAAALASDITLCMGVNHEQYDYSRHHIISGTSCTTNCLAPIAQLLDHQFGILSCLATFLHSYTGSQNLTDAAGSDLRRARAAAHNIIPTSTSAAHQLPLVLPALKGKFEAIAVRVPTPNTHLADFTAKLSRPTNQAEILALLQAAASQPPLKDIVAIDNSQLVSRDLIGSSYSSVVDAAHIYVQEDFVKLLVWHDNEFSYCRRIIDLLGHIAASLV